MRRVLFFTLGMGLVQLLFIVNMAHAQSHPFLIVTESDYPELRARASNSPWKEMKSEAIDFVNNNSWDPGLEDRLKCARLSDIMGAGALAYILDTANRESYKSKIIATMPHWDEIYEMRNSDLYAYKVSGGAAFFNSVLALDIIYDDLTSGERSGIESKLDKNADWMYSSSETSVYRHSYYGIWALYQGDRSRIDAGRNGWRSAFLDFLTDNGVFTDGPGYTHASMNSWQGPRLTKMEFHHVLEFTGEDNNWYSDPKVTAFYEWAFAGAVNPFHKYPSFGDSAPNEYDPPGVSAFGAYRFSGQAARNAAWRIRETNYDPPGRLMFYVIMGQQLPASEKPLSNIWNDGNASFWEDNPSDQSLMGSLWNCTRIGGADHEHKDVNSIYIAAYGEHVLRNVGYAGWGRPEDDWDYIFNQAVSNNTVMIEGNNHSQKHGGGITEGFTTPLFDYASGASGDALPNDDHQRNFCFVHPQDGGNGYFVTFDEVDADNSSHEANVAMHPNADNSTTISDKLEYRAIIAPYTYSGHDVYLSTFLATEPSSVSIRDGIMARGWNESKCFTGKYIYSSYDTDSSGKCNIVTILFPHDEAHAKADMIRISGSGYSGAEIDLGSSITDIALESSDTSEVTYNGVSFKGTASLYRLNSDSLGFYFVRGGRSFNDGATPRLGFTSDTNVGVYVKEMEGKIISSGAEVTFYYPGIANVLINGVSAGILDFGDDRITITVPAGTHDIEFSTDSIPRGTISGTVTDSITGNPIEGATVSDGIRYDDTDAVGNYTLLYVPVDTFTITASKLGYFSSSVDSVVVTENGTTIIDFQLTEEPAGTISGTVTDISTGNPVQGALVSDGTRSDSTDAVGHYTLTDVPVNSYTVTASKSGYFSLSSDNVVVTEDDTTIVDFQLTWISDLVGFWRFEETSGTTAYDSSGNHNDGMVYGPVSTSGRIDLAYKFGGYVDYITVPKSVSLDGITEAITLIAWVKLPDRYRHTILSRWVYGDGNERAFEFDIEKGKVWFGLSGNGSGGTFLNSANAITPDEWSHVAATSDGSNMKIYINGVLDPMTEVPPSSIHTSSADLQIGRWMTGPDQWFYPFDGTMDEVKIYNRALTEQEIEDDYNLAPVGINENPVSLPLDGFVQAYPNPFNYSTTISYITAVTGNVTINIYNLSGQKIRTLVNETRKADHHSVVWDGTNATGGSASPGIYFCTLSIDNRPIATNKIVLLK